MTPEPAGKLFDPDSDLVTGPDVPGAFTEPILATDQIQGNVLPGFNTLFLALLGARVPTAQPAAARRWLAPLLPEISTLEAVNDFRNLRRRRLRKGLDRPPSPVWTNIAFSIEGLNLLGATTAGIADSSFKAGMAALSRSLGDPREPVHEGHVNNWVVGGSEHTTPHVLLLIGADQRDDVTARLETIADAAPAAGVEVIYEQVGEGLTDDREHFGFRDGISQVAARGRLSNQERHYLSRRYIDPEDERARTYARPGQPLVWPGQFILGYGRQLEHSPEAGPQRDGGEAWMENGSYLVFRRLRQDVAAFRRFINNEAEKFRQLAGFTELTPDRLAALLVGRWPNGTALARNPDRDDPDPMADRLTANHFAFAEGTEPVRVCADPQVARESFALAPPPELRTVSGALEDIGGTRCPKFAHIRKVNPRDLTTDQSGPEGTLTFQILRRGITWGLPYPAEQDAQADDDGQRGLLFLGYQASIENQFELLNNKWMNRPHGPEGDSGHDLLVGQNHANPATRTSLLRTSTAQQAPIETQDEWVIPTGGGYFFAPSIKALATLAA